MQARTVRFAPTPNSSPDFSSCSCDSNSSCRLRRRQRKRHSVPVVPTAKVMPSILRSSSARMPRVRKKRRRGPTVLSLKDLCLDTLIQNVIAISDSLSKRLFAWLILVLSTVSTQGMLVSTQSPSYKYLSQLCQYGYLFVFANVSRIRRSANGTALINQVDQLLLTRPWGSQLQINNRLRYFLTT